MRYVKYIFGCIAALALYSCEKVIQIDLNEAEKKYVIEGMLTDQPNSCKVLISRTVNFEENSGFNGAPGAQVTVRTSTGQEAVLTETAPGIYENESLIGAPGNSYELTVLINGKTFTASSMMPARVELDSIFIRENTFFNEKVNLLNLRFFDPPGKGNCYRFIQYVNGKKDKTVFVRKDDLVDNAMVSTQLFSRGDESDEDEGAKIETGDVVKAEILCIDPDVYRFWYSLSQSATGVNESASPANPVTNISGGALGYFSAHTYDTKTITVP